MKKKQCLIIAGEKSGEEHCLSFYDELSRACPDVHFFGVGGDEMISRGFEALYHLKDFSSMGFSEVIGKIPFYLKALKEVEQQVESRSCDVAILIDFQGFNMRLAKKLKKQGVKILYYVAPQAWVWKPGRAKVLEKTVHTLFTILPFEKKWFQDRGVTRVKSIMHPLVTHYSKDLEQMSLGLEAKPFPGDSHDFNLLLLPGSRNFEVIELLPIFLGVVKKLSKTYRFSVSLVKTTSVRPGVYDYYEEIFNEFGVKFYNSEELPKALEKATLSLAASGTVTLGTALFEVPTVVAYRGSILNEYIFDMLPYKGPVSLANIIHGKIVFPEFLQNSATIFNISNALIPWLESRLQYEETKKELAKTRALLSGENFSLPEYLGKVIMEG